MIPHFNWETPLKIDDAYIGSLVKKAGGHPLHAPEHFLMWNDKCKYHDKFIVSHPAKQKGCRDFLTTKANLEMGRIKDHIYAKEISYFAYQKRIKAEKDPKKNKKPTENKKNAIAQTTENNKKAVISQTTENKKNAIAQTTENNKKAVTSQTTENKKNEIISKTTDKGIGQTTTPHKNGTKTGNVT